MRNHLSPLGFTHCLLWFSITTDIKFGAPLVAMPSADGTITFSAPQATIPGTPTRPAMLSTSTDTLGLSTTMAHVTVSRGCDRMGPFREESFSPLITYLLF